MSKYYKAEDVIKKLAEEYASTSKWSYGNDDTWEDWVDTASDILCDLPTIEVSEDNKVLYGTDHNCILTMFGDCSYSETGCSDCAVAEKIRKALSIEVSEDCISRQQAIEILCRSRCGVRARECPAHSCPIIEKYDNLPPKTQIKTQNSNLTFEKTEVSEDCISRKWLVDNAEFFSQYDKNMWVVPLSKLADAPSVVPCCDNEKSNKFQQELQQAEDCISRSALYKELDKVTAVTPTQIDMFSDFTDIIKNAPSVVPSRAEGEWIDNHNGTYTCSECGNKHSKSKYCSECGAKMKG